MAIVVRANHRVGKVFIRWNHVHLGDVLAKELYVLQYASVPHGKYRLTTLTDIIFMQS